MLWFKLIKQIAMILQSEISPKQIAAGAVLGMMMGFAPVKCLHAYVLMILILMLNVNIGSAAISAMLFAIMGLLIDPLSDKVGSYLLINSQMLTPLWTGLYNMPLVPFTRFNNTVVLGSLVISLLLIIPVYFAALKFIVYYRANLKEKVARWKIMKIFKLSSALNVYDKYQQ